MRLVNTKTLEFENFPDEKEIEYAILSHRWRDDEPTFQDIVSGQATKRIGYSKVRKACSYARKKRLKYIWIDTVCIDKSSSSELSEAINSMYRWYQASAMCLAYLDDVRMQNWKDEFSQSEWFTRGWTLQELIAPKNLLFLSAGWTALGTKTDMADKISSFTDIDTAYLLGERDVLEASVARRMSWAALRRTTRPEDEAYCLMGIFDVNMPMIYGEGSKAFLRLQEEIMKNSDDQSILAWDSASEMYHGPFAKSPKEFADSGDVEPASKLWYRTTHIKTNKGLSLNLFLLRHSMQLCVAPLDCVKNFGQKPKTRLGIVLAYTSIENGYLRVCFNGSSLIEFPRYMDMDPSKRRSPGGPEPIRQYSSCLILNHTKIYKFWPFAMQPEIWIRTNRVMLVEKNSQWDQTPTVNFSLADHIKAENPVKKLDFSVGQGRTPFCRMYTSPELYKYSKPHFTEIRIEAGGEPVIRLSHEVLYDGWEPSLMTNLEPGSKNPLSKYDDPMLLDRKSFTIRGTRTSGIDQIVGGLHFSMNVEAVQENLIWALDVDKTYGLVLRNHLDDLKPCSADTCACIKRERFGTIGLILQCLDCAEYMDQTWPRKLNANTLRHSNHRFKALLRLCRDEICCICKENSQTLNALVQSLGDRMLNATTERIHTFPTNYNYSDATMRTLPEAVIEF